MKKLLFFLMLFLLYRTILGQSINGYIVCDTSNFTIVKLWGTHYERGYAYGYLTGEGTTDIFKNYLKPFFGSYIEIARQWIGEGNNFHIDERYKTEAMGVIDGMNTAGINTEEFDYIDILVCNIFLDIYGFFVDSDPEFPGCSALMSWGSATEGTDIDGKSVISRHVDWSISDALVRNQVVVVHIPSEEDEQPWLLIGFKGQISSLSGINNSGMAAFMHSLSDVNAEATEGRAYEPIWFSIRKAMEVMDYNNDSQNDVNDIKDVLFANTFGYPKASIISCISSSQNSLDTLIAMVAELACVEPYHTFRTNAFEDLIPGDNLYAANNSIARNNSYNYCTRYYSVVNNIGDGTGIGSETNWALLRDYSQSTSNNLQFMQFIPDNRILKLSVADSEYTAYQKAPVIMHLDSLFKLPDPPIFINERVGIDLNVYPNPSDGIINFSYKSANEEIDLIILSISGSVLFQKSFYLCNKSFNAEYKLEKGFYIFRLIDGSNVITGRFIVL